MRLIITLVFVASSFVSSVSAQTAGQAKHKPSRAFLENPDPKCFDATLREADIAFGKHAWADAERLYRAAKNCADANQIDRAKLNAKIAESQQSAEEELRNEQLKAIRQARHAKAGKIAQDAQALLKNLDRTTAYRLADFANEYIAPTGAENPDCRQVMLEAWNYDPTVQVGKEEKNVETPFCYEIAGNLGDSLQLHFLSSGNRRLLMAFSPKRHEINIWDINTFKLEASYPADQKAHSVYPLSDDGANLLFVGPRGLQLYRNQQPVGSLLSVTGGVSHLSIDDAGHNIYYIDHATHKIWSVEITDEGVVKSRINTGKGPLQRKSLGQPKPVGVVYGLNLLNDFSVDDRQNLWLAYQDSIIIWNKTTIGPKKGGVFWQRQPPVIFDRPELGLTPYDWYVVRLQPRDKRLYASSTIKTIELEVTETNRLVKKRTWQGDLMTQKTSPEHLVLAVQNPATLQRRLQVVSKVDSLRFAALLNDSDYFNTTAVALSSPLETEQGREIWLAAVTFGGVLKAWRLAPSASSVIRNFDQNARICLSPNGEWIAEWDSTSGLRCLPVQREGVFFNALNINPGYYTQMKVASSKWMAINSFELGDSAILISPRSIPYYVPGFGESETTVAFDHAGAQVAFAVDYDSLMVYDLSVEPPVFVAGQRVGFSPTSLCFSPDDRQLIMFAAPENEMFNAAVPLPQVWNFSQPVRGKRTLELIRLEDYFTTMIESDPISGLMAFTDGIDIRIYDLNQPDVEKTLIRQQAQRTITKIAWTPTGGVIAAGYDNGMIIFWDAQNGRKLTRLLTVPNGASNAPIEHIAFTPDGQKLLCINHAGELRSFDLDLQKILDQIEAGSRSLTAFSPEQIDLYELDQILDEEETFRQLINSGDDPLIRSFFQYCGRKVLISNNIANARHFADLANKLYAGLDTATRSDQRQYMLVMYENLIGKMLRRKGMIAEAETMLSQVKRQFGSPIDMAKTEGHLALLRGQYGRAGQLYSQWYMHFKGNIDDGFYAVNNLGAELQQFVNYDLLDDERLDFLCRLFSGTLTLYAMFCDNQDEVDPLVLLEVPEMTEAARLRWDIFKILETRGGYFVAPFDESRAAMMQVRQKAERLAQIDPKAGKPLIATAILKMAKIDLEQGVFETGSSQPEFYFDRAISLLQSIPPDEQPIAALDSLISAHLLLAGIYLYHQPQKTLDRCQQAEAAFQQLSDRLVALDRDDDDYRRRYLPNLEILRTMAYLALNQTDLAEKALENAESNTAVELSPIYRAHIAFLKKEPFKAWSKYTDLPNVIQAGTALAEMDWLVEKHQLSGLELKRFMLRLNDTLGQKWGADELEINRLLQRIRILAFEGRKVEAWKISRNAYDLALHALETYPQDRQVWVEKIVLATLNESFYGLYAYAGNQTPPGEQLLETLVKRIEIAQTLSNGYTAGPNVDMLTLNLAHILLIRNQTGDRENALKAYYKYVEQGLYGYVSPFDTIEKDFRDLKTAGFAQIPFDEIFQQIKKNAPQ